MAIKENRGKKTESSSPEKKWGPFAGGTGVAVWLNPFVTENGTRYARTITIAPRRYRDPKTKEWRDGAYRPVDLPALLLALQAADDYCASTPLPIGQMGPSGGQAVTEEHLSQAMTERVAGPQNTA